jgi:hypothetical protein
MRSLATRQLRLALTLTISLLTISLLASKLAASTGVGLARGAMIAPGALTTVDRAHLVTAISKAKKSDPVAFEMLAKVQPGGGGLLGGPAVGKGQGKRGSPGNG